MVSVVFELEVTSVDVDWGVVEMLVGVGIGTGVVVLEIELAFFRSARSTIEIKPKASILLIVYL
jgi:hypothetical protein